MFNLKGFPKIIFVAVPPEHFLCRICREVVRDPRQCRYGHICCCACLARYLEEKSECPVCLCKLSTTEWIHNLALEQLIADAVIRCPTSPSTIDITTGLQKKTCPWKGTITGILQHIREECMFVDVECPNAGCDAVMERQMLPDHERTCGCTVMKCNLCSREYNRSDGMTHCLQFHSNCPNACGSTIAEFTAAQHKQICPNELVKCPLAAVIGCESACPGWLLRKHVDQHVADLTKPEIVHVLLAKIAEDDIIIQSLKRAGTSSASEHAIQRGDVTETINRWRSRLDEVNLSVIESEMGKTMEVEGHAWSTYHLAWEACSDAFSDGRQGPFSLSSPSIELAPGVHASLFIYRGAPGGNISCSVSILGYSGEADLTVTFFKLGSEDGDNERAAQGSIARTSTTAASATENEPPTLETTVSCASRQFLQLHTVFSLSTLDPDSSNHHWEHRRWDDVFKADELVLKRWVSSENVLRVLLTVCLDV